MDDRFFYDFYEEFKGYKFHVFTKRGTQRVFTLDEKTFKEKNQLVLWFDFLIKTNQWIPYAVWQDLFNLPEYMYYEFKEIDHMETCYIEIINKMKKVNLL
jgi:hypothetical protein